MNGPVKILIICGTGIATSTVVASKLDAHLAGRSDAGRFSVMQGKVTDLLSDTRGADVILATTEVPAAVVVPVVNAVPLLTGIGAEAVFAAFDRAVEGLG